MTAPTRDFVELPTGYRSREAASFIAQLDTLSGYMTGDLAGITPEELEWQPAPGMNTIGMLLAHIAIVEVLWFQVGVLNIAVDIDAVIGIGRDDDGIPMEAGAAPPAVLAGKPLAFYQDLLDRARAFARRAATELSDTDLDAARERTRRDGVHQTYNVRWVMFHALEHLAGHYGQILLLRHHYRARTMV